MVGLGRLIWKSSVTNIFVSILSFAFIGIVFLFLGASEYNDYVLILATTSLVMIVVDIIPSQKYVFKLQDDKNSKLILWQLQKFLSVVVFAVAFPIFYFAFETGLLLSIAISVYCVTQTFKRYLDINLQAEGKINQLYKVELVVVFLKIALLLTFISLNTSTQISIWLSISISYSLAYFLLFIKNSRSESLTENPEETKVRLLNAWNELVDSKNYYLLSLSKRLKDSALPIILNLTGKDKNVIGSFLFVYRIMAVILAQARVLESMLNFRGYMNELINKKTSFYGLIALVCQMVFIIMTCIIFFIKNKEIRLPDTQVLFGFLALSFYPFIYIFSIKNRANLLSKFRILPLTISNFTFAMTISMVVGILKLSSVHLVLAMSILILLAEFFSLRILNYAVKKYT